MSSNTGFEFAAKTDVGLLRPQNEDAVAVNPAFGIAVLADGMGGYNAGEVASRIAVTVTMQALEEGIARLRAQSGTRTLWGKPLHQMLAEAVGCANTAILQAACDTPQYSGMGTTIVAAVLHQDTVTIAHVGDSRAYRLRAGELQQLTRDHSLLQEQIDAGLISPESARHAQIKNLVTRAVGVEADIDVEVHDHRVLPGDIYLLCSDGLSDMLAPEEMRELLTEQGASLDALTGALVRRANEHGGHDNISAILLHVHTPDVRIGGLLGRIIGWIS